MRQFKLIFIATIFMTSNSIGQTFKPNEIADKLFTAFQTKSYESYKKLLFNTSDYQESLNDFFKNNNVGDSERKEFAEKKKLFADSADSQYRKEFERLLNKGVKLGIDWTKIRKGKFVFKEANAVNSYKKSLSGHLNFLYNDSTYVIFGIEAIELSSGYKISDIRTVLKGGVGQYVDPDLLDDDDM